MFSPYFWQLGGTQSDNNLFPDVDSSWKVCKQCHLSSGYLLFFFLFCKHGGCLKNAMTQKTDQSNQTVWIGSATLNPNQKFCFFLFLFL